MSAGKYLTGPCPPAGKPLTVAGPTGLTGPTGPKAGFKSRRQSPISQE